MARRSRRHDMMAVALTAFVDRGFEGASIGDIAEEVGVTKAAISYHFPAKDDLLLALSEPMLGELEAVVDAHRGDLDWPAEVRAFLVDYVEVLGRHADVATWLDADRSVLSHPVVGERLARLHAEARGLLAAAVPDGSEVTATSALGAMWRPIRNLGPTSADDRHHLVDAAVAALGTAAT